MDECATANPGEACIELRRNSTCTDENFATSRTSGLVIAAPSTGTDRCASDSEVRFYVPDNVTQALNYHRQKPGGVLYTMYSVSGPSCASLVRMWSMVETMMPCSFGR